MEQFIDLTSALDLKNHGDLDKGSARISWLHDRQQIKWQLAQDMLAAFGFDAPPRDAQWTSSKRPYFQHKKLGADLFGTNDPLTPMFKPEHRANNKEFLNKRGIDLLERALKAAVNAARQKLPPKSPVVPAPPAIKATLTEDAAVNPPVLEAPPVAVRAAVTAIPTEVITEQPSTTNLMEYKTKELTMDSTAPNATLVFDTSALFRLTQNDGHRTLLEEIGPKLIANPAINIIVPGRVVAEKLGFEPEFQNGQLRFKDIDHKPDSRSNIGARGFLKDAYYRVVDKDGNTLGLFTGDPTQDNGLNGLERVVPEHESQKHKVEVWITPEELKIAKKLIAIGGAYEGDERQAELRRIRNSKEIKGSGETFALEAAKAQTRPVYIVADDYRAPMLQPQSKTSTGLPISNLNTLKLIDAMIKASDGRLRYSNGDQVLLEPIRDGMVKWGGLDRETKAIEVRGVDADGKKAPELSEVLKAGLKMAPVVAAHAQLDLVVSHSPLASEERPAGSNGSIAITAASPAAAETILPAATALAIAASPTVSNVQEDMGRAGDSGDEEEPDTGVTAAEALSRRKPRPQAAKRQEIPFEERFGTKLWEERMAYEDQSLTKGELTEAKLAEKIMDKATSPGQKEITDSTVRRWERGRDIPDAATYKILELILIDENENLEPEDKDARRTELSEAYKESSKAFKDNPEGLSRAHMAFGDCMDELTHSKDNLANAIVSASLNTRLYPKIEEIEEGVEIDNRFIFKIEAGAHLPSEGLRKVIYDVMNLSEEKRKEMDAAYEETKKAKENSAGPLDTDEMHMRIAIRARLRSFFKYRDEALDREHWKPLSNTKIAELSGISPTDTGFWNDLFGNSTKRLRVFGEDTFEEKRDGLIRAIREIWRDASPEEVNAEIKEFKRALADYQSLAIAYRESTIVARRMRHGDEASMAVG